jgi:hypothetical protein
VFTTALLLTLFFIDLEAGAQSQRFRDFSRKDSDYAPLKNLRFASNDITYSGPENVEIFGRSYPARRYSLTVTVTVETGEVLGPTSTAFYQKRPANFEIFVAEDRDLGIHVYADQNLSDPKQSAFIMGRAGVYKQNLCQDRPHEIQDGERLSHKAGLYGAGYEGQVPCTQPEQLPRAQWITLAKDRRHLRTKTRSRDNKHLPSRLLEL